MNATAILALLPDSYEEAENFAAQIQDAIDAGHISKESMEDKSRAMIFFFEMLSYGD